MAETDLRLAFHRWPSNERDGLLPSNDRCLECGVPRFSDDPWEICLATSSCPAGQTDG